MGSQVPLLDRGELADMALEDLHLVVDGVDVNLRTSRKGEKAKVIIATYRKNKLG